MNTIEIKYFRAYSGLGGELAEMVREVTNAMLIKYGYEANFSICESRGLRPTTEHRETSAFQLLKYALNNEIVIVDASIEREVGSSIDNHLGENYECLTPAAMNLDNIIILSRTQIPLNFLPKRTNVCKLGQETDLVNRANDSEHGFSKSYSNKQIETWLKGELERMVQNISVGKNQVRYNRIFRDPELTVDITKYDMTTLIKRQQVVMNENEEALKREKVRNKGSRKVFISYRGCYCNNYYQSDSGERFVMDKIRSDSEQQPESLCCIRVIDEIDKYVKSTESATGTEIRFFREGALSNEFMPEVRRWGFVSYIDRVIRECDEFWIFQTKHKVVCGKETKGYWDSWWCLAEILTVMRMYADEQLKDDFKVFIYNPEEEEINRIQQVDYKKWHKITEEENEELARYYANSDFLEAGYESAKNMRHIRYYPHIFQKMKYHIAKMGLKYMMDEETGSEYAFSTFYKSVHSHVYDKSFYTGRIYTSPKDSPKGNDMTILQDDNFIWSFLNINGWYSNPKNTSGHVVPKYPGAEFIEESEFTEQKRKQIGVIKDENDEFYIWWTPRRYRRTGPNNCIIEVVELFKNS